MTTTHTIDVTVHTIYSVQRVRLSYEDRIKAEKKLAELQQRYGDNIESLCLTISSCLTLI